MITLLMLLAMADTRHISIEAGPPPLPPILKDSRPTREAVLVEFRPGEVRCRGAIVAPRYTVKPRPAGFYRTASTSVPGYSLSFAIDAEGRPVGIARPERLAREGYIATDDLAPALALWRFAPGAARSNCSVSFDPDPQPIASMPIDKIFEYAADTNRGWPGWHETLARLRTVDCAKPRHPRFLLRAFPDNEKIPQPPGTFAHSIVGFDIAPSGKPVRIRTVSSGGNAALDRAALAAVAKSRYVEGDPRTGCTLPIGRRASAPIPPPAAPEPAAYRPAGATCPADVKWEKMPKLTFPEPFRRRSIEGWAIVRFDVAPWGTPGNLEVVASEPAAAFGEQARTILSQARVQSAEQGATGCVERVRFKIDPLGGSAVEAAEEIVAAH